MRLDILNVNCEFVDGMSIHVYAVQPVAKGHLDELQTAEIVKTSKLAPPVIIKTHYWINHR